MTDTQAPAVPTPTPSGWFTDPADASRLRWWNGTNWTEHVQVPPPQPTPVEIAAAQAAAAAAEQRAVEAASVPFSRDWNSYNGASAAESWQGGAQTFPAWLLAFSPIWFGGSGIGVRFLAQVLPIPAVVQDVATLAIGVLLVCALAHLDAKRLAARGYTRSTSPFWAILLPVFFILRTVRVGVRGLAVAIVAWVLSLLLAVIVAVAVVLGFAAAVSMASGQTGASGTPAAPVPISAAERAFELTPTGMAARLSKDLSLGGRVAAPAVSCMPLPSTVAGAVTSCVVTESNSRSATVWLVVTPEYPYAAFQTTARPAGSPTT